MSGAAADLAWWLTGRGTGDGLTSEDGELPGIAGMVSYTGEVTPGGEPDTRELAR